MKVWKSKTDAPAALQGLLVSVEGGFALPAEIATALGLEGAGGGGGGGDGDALKEFRQKNIELAKQLREAQAAVDAIKAKFEGIDPEAVKAMVQKQASEEDKALLAAGKFDELFAKRWDTHKTSYERQVQALNEKLANEQKAAQKYRARVRESEAVAKLVDALAASKVKVRPSAMADLRRRALDLFDMDEKGDLVAMRDGSPHVNKDGKPYNWSDFVAEQFESAPHIFEDGAGGGATGGGKRNAAGQIVVSPMNGIALDQMEAVASGKLDARLG